MNFQKYPDTCGQSLSNDISKSSENENNQNRSEDLFIPETNSLNPTSSRSRNGVNPNFSSFEITAVETSFFFLKAFANSS